MPECNRQCFQPARQRLAMNFLNAQRNLPERHRFGTRCFDGRGDLGIRQCAGTPAFMSGQQTTEAFVVPSVHPVVHRLVAHIEFDRDLMNPPAAAKLQQTQPTGSKVFMWMFERQLLQGLLLLLGQFNGTFHRQAGHQNRIACQTPYFEIRLLVTLIR